MNWMGANSRHWKYASRSLLWRSLFRRSTLPAGKAVRLDQTFNRISLKSLLHKLVLDQVKIAAIRFCNQITLFIEDGFNHKKSRLQYPLFSMQLMTWTGVKYLIQCLLLSRFLQNSFLSNRLIKVYLVCKVSLLGISMTIFARVGSQSLLPHRPVFAWQFWTQIECFLHAIWIVHSSSNMASSVGTLLKVSVIWAL